MDQQLKNYIYQSRQEGKTDEQINQELLNSGWSQKDIDENINPGILNKISVLQITWTPKFVVLLTGLLVIGGLAYGSIWYWQKQSTTNIIPSFTPRPSHSLESNDVSGTPITSFNSQCLSVDNYPTSQIKYPRNDKAILLISGLIKKENMEINFEPLYRLSYGMYDEKFNRTSEGDFMWQIIDQNGVVLKQLGMNSSQMFMMFADPGGVQKTTIVPLMISAPYPQGARKIIATYQKQKKVDIDIFSRLLRDSINEIGNNIFVSDKSLFITKANEIIDKLDKCFQNKNDLSAARILEFDFLPLLNNSLNDTKKNTPVELDKKEMLELTNDTIIRLDPLLASSSLPN